MDHVLFQCDKRFVMKAFRQGDFDFVHRMSEVEETQRFRCAPKPVFVYRWVREAARRLREV